MSIGTMYKLDTPDGWGNEPQGTFKRVCFDACHRSAWYGCTVHVNALLTCNESGATVTGYMSDDWSDGSTVRSYTNGFERI